MNEWRVQNGDRFQLVTAASNATDLFARVIVTDDAGQDRPFELQHTPNSDRTLATTTAAGIVSTAGYVTRASVGTLTADSLKRGELWAELLIKDRNDRNVGVLCADYTGALKNLQLGHLTQPTDGKGFLSWVQEADDIAGNVSDTTTLAVANARRVVRGIIVKYHSSSDVATRTLTITLRDMASAVGPTGWSNDSDTWVSPTLTLTADEEGLIHVGEHGFVSTNDDGTLAYADNSSAPNPFPLEVQDADTVDIIVAAGAGEAADDYDVWVQYEEWIDP